MYLTQYENITTDNQGVINSNGYPLYLYEEQISAGYVDITCVENLDRFGSQLGFDYLKLKDVISDLIEVDGFEALTPNEKIIACKYNIGTYAEKLAAVNEDTSVLKQLIINHHYKALECRMERIERVAAFILYYFDGVYDGDIEVRALISQHLTDNGYFERYLYFNQAGKYFGGTIEGVADYLSSKAGTSWEFTGLKTSGYTPNEGTIDEVVDLLLDIIQNGFYEFTISE